MYVEQIFWYSQFVTIFTTMFHVLWQLSSMHCAIRIPFSYPGSMSTVEKLIENFTNSLKSIRPQHRQWIMLRYKMNVTIKVASISENPKIKLLIWLKLWIESFADIRTILCNIYRCSKQCIQCVCVCLCVHHVLNANWYLMRNIKCKMLFNINSKINFIHSINFFLPLTVPIFGDPINSIG